MEEKVSVVIVGGSRPAANGRPQVQKGVSNYITAAITEFGRGAEVVILRARGKAITLAVDTALKLGRLPGYACAEQARIGTEAVGQNGDLVSFIEITVRLAEGSKNEQ